MLTHGDGILGNVDFVVSATHKRMTDSLLMPVFAHLILVAGLYAALTVVRAPEVWGVGKGLAGDFKVYEPRISANLRNQFEWPLLFYVVVLILMREDGPMPATQVWLAWIFVVGRGLHSVVQIGTSNIRLRGMVFTVNFLAVLCMWVLLVV